MGHEASPPLWDPSLPGPGMRPLLRSPPAPSPSPRGGERLPKSSQGGDGANFGPAQPPRRPRTPDPQGGEGSARGTHGRPGPPRAAPPYLSGVLGSGLRRGPGSLGRDFGGAEGIFFFSVVCRRGRGMSCCFQVPGAGRPARGEPPGSLCRGCAWQARPGCSLGSGRLRARHVGFTTAQNTSVRVWCGVHGGEGGEGEGSHQRAGAQGPFFGNIPHFVPPLNF